LFPGDQIHNGGLKYHISIRIRLLALFYWDIRAKISGDYKNINKISENQM